MINCKGIESLPPGYYDLKLLSISSGEYFINKVIPWEELEKNGINESIRNEETIENLYEYDFCFGYLVLPGNIKKIYKEMFKGNTFLSVKMSDDVEIIEDSAFFGSTLECIDLPKNLKKIGDYAFYKSFLKEITLPESVTSLGRSCFDLCDRLKSVTLSKNIINIPYCCFKDCTQLKTINLENVENVYNESFNNCINLEEINLESIKKIHYSAFFKCKQLSSVKLGKKLTEIGIDAFENALKLKNIELPENIRICTSAFSGTDIELLNIPKNAYLEDLALTGMYNLKKLYINKARHIGNMTDNFDFNPIIYIDAKTYNSFKENISGKDIIIVTKTLNELLDENKSFKEINKILKDDIEL